MTILSVTIIVDLFLIGVLIFHWKTHPPSERKKMNKGCWAVDIASIIGICIISFLGFSFYFYH